MSFHLVYRPAELPERPQDEIVNLMDTQDPIDILLHTQPTPDTISLELMAEDIEEVLQEISDLGF